MPSVEERFLDKVNKTDTCWLWTGKPNKDGYGRMSIKKTDFLAHRLAYTFWIGSIPEDKPCVLHKCDTPACVNPNHLFAGTHTDNAKDKFNKNRHAKGKMLPNGGKTHCKHGHEFTKENTYIHNNKRACRTCRKRIDAASYKRKKVQNA